MSDFLTFMFQCEALFAIKPLLLHKQIVFKDRGKKTIKKEISSYL